MGTDATLPNKLKSYLQLGRVSNLPTVWTNVLAGIVLAGGAMTILNFLVLAVALSCFYLGGMFLNDAFDREHDRHARPDRPIPAGAATAEEVFAVGFGLLCGGLLVLGYLSLQSGWQVLAAGLLLALLIVFYDLHHKHNPWSPLVMAACRAMIYVVAALAVGPVLPEPALIGAACLFSYMVGLSWLARFENAPRPGPWWPIFLLWVPVIVTALRAKPTLGTGLLWSGVFGWMGYATWFTTKGDTYQVRQSIGFWIVGISLLDACLITSQGRPDLALYAVMGCLATVALQRWVQGT